MATGVAHGAGTSTQGKGLLNSRCDTASNAWAQSIPANASRPATAMLTTPSGDRVEITSAVVPENNGGGTGFERCTIMASVNGASVSYAIDFHVDGDNFAIQPIYADSGSITCPAGGTGFIATLVGYLTPVPR